MKCPICISKIKNCPFCIKTTIIPESLIVVIQNINQNYTKEQRDQALIDLTNQFQYLLKKNAAYFYKTYNLREKDYDYNDFYQDVLLEFFDLVINDFKIKEQGDNSLAVFGNYIKNKLYRRIQYGIQEKIKKFGWANEVTIDFIVGIDGSNNDTSSRIGSASIFRKEIFEATLQQIIECEEKDLDSIRDEKCIQILKKIYQISFNEKICQQTDGEIWRLHWFSGKSVEQIDEYLMMEMGYKCKIGESRIRQIVKRINQQIIAEFGRSSVLGDLQ